MASSFTYDDYGNTISFDGFNLTIIRGSILSSIIDGNNTYNYHYNSDGRSFFKVMKSAYGMELRILYRLKYGNKLHKLWWILNLERRFRKRLYGR